MTARSLTTHEPSLHITRRYDAPAADVFDAWVSPDMMRRWWHAGPNWSTAHAEVDLRVGGQFSVTMQTDDGTPHTGTGIYTVIDPPAHLAWRWIGEGENRADTIVHVELTEADGRTTVELRQWGLGDEAAADFRIGWQLCLDNLSRALAESGTVR